MCNDYWLESPEASGLAEVLRGGSRGEGLHGSRNLEHAKFNIAAQAARLDEVRTVLMGMLRRQPRERASPLPSPPFTFRPLPYWRRSAQAKGRSKPRSAKAGTISVVKEGREGRESGSEIEQSVSKSQETAIGEQMRKLRGVQCRGSRSCEI